MSEWSEVVAGAIGVVLGFAIPAAISRYTCRRDGTRIFNWLKSESGKPGNFKFRSTRRIAKEVSLEPSRVAQVCYMDKRIDPVIGERDDLWTLSGKS